MNTGEHLWYIPVGETPDRIRNHPALEGIDVGDTGTGTVAPMTATPTLLMYASAMGDDTPALFAVDKMTGEQVGKVAVPDSSRYGMSSWMHEGRQYVILQTGGRLTALALPE
jgi:quinoprotein glucose dehydrogenase